MYDMICYYDSVVFDFVVLVVIVVVICDLVEWFVLVFWYVWLGGMDW